MTRRRPCQAQTLVMGKRELIVLLALLMSLNALAIDAMVPALDEMARELGVLRWQPPPVGDRRSIRLRWAWAA